MVLEFESVEAARAWYFSEGYQNAVKNSDRQNAKIEHDRALEQVITWRGKPAIIRCDNGPEFISEKLREWAEGNGVEIRFIQPGKQVRMG